MILNTTFTGLVPFESEFQVYGYSNACELCRQKFNTNLSFEGYFSDNVFNWSLTKAKSRQTTKFGTFLLPGNKQFPVNS